MANLEPRLPEQYRPEGDRADDFHVNELAADVAGSLSPFGSDIEFPLPLDQITYRHPSPSDRPNLAPAVLAAAKRKGKGRRR
jgi:succinate dehydrogenase / fumarate reductase iron-sulfur subunit